MAYKFTYRKEGNEYVFYRDEESVLLEDGIALATVNEDLAAEILKALEKQEHPGDETSILHFHFATLLGKPHEDAYTEEIEGLCYDDLLEDNYLMFRQVAPMRQIIAQHFADNLPAQLASLPVHRKIAIVTFAQTCHSYMLPYYLLIDVIEQENKEECKEAFMDDLLELYEKTLGTEQEAKDFLKVMTPVIENYIRYMSYEEV